MAKQSKVLSLGSLFILCWANTAALANEKKLGKPAAKASVGAKADGEISSEKDETAAIAAKDLALGVGILTLGPPVVGAEIVYTYQTRFTLALESGSFQLSLPENKIKSNFNGIHVRYSFSAGKPFFVGLGYAQQSANIESVTDATISVDDETAGTTTEQKESITWTVKLTQPLVIPHAGWMWMWESGAALTLGLGIQIPVSTDMEISGDPGANTTLTPEKIEEAKKDKTDQVKQFLDTPLPYVSLKFSWFVDAF